MKKLIILLLFIPLLSCGGGDKNKKTEPIITIDTPSAKIDNLYDLLTEKICFGNKIREKELWNERIIEISGEILEFGENYIRVMDKDEVFNDLLGYGTYTQMEVIRVYLDKETILKLNKRQKVRVKGVLNIPGGPDKICDSDSHYIYPAILF